MITEIEQESESNQSEVKKTIADLRKIIDDQEKVLLENIQDVEKEQKKSVEEYKCQLQGQQQSLIEEVFKFVDAGRDKQPKKRKEAKKKFDDYKEGAVKKLLELKPLTRTANHIPGLEKLKEMKVQIQNITVEPVPIHVNPQLQERITGNGTNTTLNLSGANLTDKDMEIVAKEIELNEVRDLFFFLPFRLFRSPKWILVIYRLVYF